MTRFERENEASILLPVCFSIALFALSFGIPGKVHAYLLGNLLLGAIPLLFSYAASSLYEKKQRVNALIAALGFFWLLFLPNAFYLITDLLHIENASFQANYSAAPPLIAFSEIFNLILFSSFIWTGYIFGVLSVRKIHRIIQTAFGSTAGTVAVIGFFFLSSVGVYLGRILRLNSWDLIVAPLQTFRRIADQSLNFRPVEIVVFLGLFTGFLWVVYQTVYQKSPIRSHDGIGET